MVQRSIKDIEFKSTDDLEVLISILPSRVQNYLKNHPEKYDLVEVILDLESCE